MAPTRTCRGLDVYCGSGLAHPVPADRRTSGGNEYHNPVTVFPTPLRILCLLASWDGNHDARQP
jgi:hypothetical protein